MKTYTKILRILVLTLFIGFVSFINANSQTTLFTEDWESAAIGQVPPPGWSTEVVSGTLNMTYFLQNGAFPSCLPFSGNRMVEFQSFYNPTGTNRLKRTTPT